MHIPQGLETVNITHIFININKQNNILSWTYLPLSFKKIVLKTIIWSSDSQIIVSKFIFVTLQAQNTLLGIIFKPSVPLLPTLGEERNRINIDERVTEWIKELIIKTGNGKR